MFRLFRFLFWFGIISIILAWIVIGTCWYINPWFVFTEHAFSDFGGSKASIPELYNYGLILTGFLVILFGSSLIYFSENKFEIIGGSYIALSGIFLALIGVYHSGTRPHTFVSTWFFVQIYIGLVILGIGMHMRKLRYSTLVLSISLPSLPISEVIDALWGWPSAAVVEAYGIIIIDICVILITLAYIKIIQLIDLHPPMNRWDSFGHR